MCQTMQFEDIYDIHNKLNRQKFVYFSAMKSFEFILVDFT